MIEDYDDAILLFDPDGKIRASLARTSFYDSRPALCGPEVQSMGKASASLFARFWFAELSKKNAVLDYIGRDPSVAGTRPADIEKDDGYAQDLALIDMNCLARGAISSSDADNYRTRQLDSLGAYWVAKGENFGSISDEESAWGVSLDQRARIKALCDSKAAYARALDYTKTKNRPDYPVFNPDDSRTNPYDTLDQQLTNDDNNALPFTIQTGLARAKRDLRGFPAADVADACK
jgi:hypothetical protein